MEKFKRKYPKEKYNNKYLRINSIKILLNKICLLYFILIKGFKSNSIVQIVINNIGVQKILSDEFPKPDEILINGKEQNYTEYYNLTNSENNILMKWNNQLSNLNISFLILIILLKLI